jgi:phospholipase C
MALQDPAFDTAYNFIEPNYGELFFGQHMKCGTSMHPIDDVTRGDGLIKTVYEAIRNSPHWDDSLLIVTFDEHGGFYDHVPPPQAVAPGDNYPDPSLNKHGFDFRHLGVRVPTIVVSAWTPKNTLDGKNYDHAVVPRTLEELFELEPMTQRDASARSLTSHLALSQPRLDALTELPPPSTSNFHGCDGGLLGWLEKVVAELPAAFERAEPPNSVTQTFVHAAVRREVQMSGLEAGAAMAAQLKGLKSQHEAATYIHHTRLKYRGFTRRPIASVQVEIPRQSDLGRSDAGGSRRRIEH